MAPEKESSRSRARRKRSEGRSDRGYVERTVEEAGQDGGVTLVDADPCAAERKTRPQI
jgi:hypothetical protein